MTAYTVTVLNWDAQLVYRECHDIRRRTVSITPSIHTAVICIATPEGQILALAAMPHLHPAQHPPTIHVRLEHT